MLQPSSIVVAAAILLASVARGDDRPAWIKATAYELASELTNQESGYSSLVEGRNGRLYIGAAEYDVDAYLVELDEASRLAGRGGRHEADRLDGDRLRRAGEVSHEEQHRRERPDLLRHQAGLPRAGPSPGTTASERPRSAPSRRCTTWPSARRRTARSI